MSLGLISRCGEGHFWTPGWEARGRGQDTMALDFLVGFGLLVGALGIWGADTNPGSTRSCVKSSGGLPMPWKKI